MAWGVVFKCKGCINQCPVIPLPLDWLAWLAGHDRDEVKARSYELYTGKIVMGVCPTKKQMFFSNFMEAQK
jgi:hypothetical protein